MEITSKSYLSLLQIASNLAGFSLGEADLLRRAVSKKNRDVLDEQRNHFVKGCLQNGYNEQTAQQIYDLIVRFANYGFNRSHAVAYSMIGYQLAYLKANYPLQFMAALLSSAIGNEDKVMQYVREAKRRDIIILPPSLQKSGYHFRVEGEGIRYSLLAMKNIGVATVKAIMEERKIAPFTDLFEFCVRMPSKFVTDRNLETFIHAGCFDCFGVNRASLHESIERALKYARLVRPSNAEEADMFLGEDLVPKPNYASVEEFTFMDLLNKEKDALGFYLSSYPTAQYKDLIQTLEIPTLLQAMKEKKKGQRAIVYITSVKVIRTKKLQKMAFLTVCDQDEELEAVVFPETYLHFSEHLEEGAVVLLDGTIEKRNGRVQWIVNGIHPLEPISAYEEMKEATVYVKLASQYEKSLFYQVTKKLFHYPGYTKVLIYYEKEHKVVQLSSGLSIYPSQACLQALYEIVGKENVVLKN